MFLLRQGVVVVAVPVVVVVVVVVAGLIPIQVWDAVNEDWTSDAYDCPGICLRPHHQGNYFHSRLKMSLFFVNRSYLRNGRAVVMVVVHSSVCHVWTVAKRCKIGSRLLLIIDRKSHIAFQMTWKWWTLDDLEGHWRPVRLTVLATAGLYVVVVVAVVNPSWQYVRANATDKMVNSQQVSYCMSRSVSLIFCIVIFKILSYLLRMVTDLEYLDNFLNLENFRNYQGILCSLRENRIASLDAVFGVQKCLQPGVCPKPHWGVYSASPDYHYCLSNAMHSIGQSIKSPECPSVRPFMRPTFLKLSFFRLPFLLYLFLLLSPSPFSFPFPSSSLSLPIPLPFLLPLFLHLSRFPFPFTSSFLPLLFFLSLSLSFFPFFFFSPLPPLFSFLFPFPLPLPLSLLLPFPSPFLFPSFSPSTFSFPFLFLPLLFPLFLLCSFFPFPRPCIQHLRCHISVTVPDGSWSPWTTHRKSTPVSRMVTWPMTSRDPKRSNSWPHYLWGAISL